MPAGGTGGTTLSPAPPRTPGGGRFFTAKRINASKAMTVEQVYNELKKLNMNGRSWEGRVGDCELRVNKTSYSIGGMTFYPNKK